VNLLYTADFNVSFLQKN